LQRTDVRLKEMLEVYLSLLKTRYSLQDNRILVLFSFFASRSVLAITTFLFANMHIHIFIEAVLDFRSDSSFY